MRITVDSIWASKRAKKLAWRNRTSDFKRLLASSLFMKFPSHKIDENYQFSDEECSDLGMDEYEMRHARELAFHRWKLFQKFVSEILSPTSQLFLTWEKLVARHNEALSVLVPQHIKSMRYADFLKTPYWKTISARVKKRDGKCVECNAKPHVLGLLHAHHTTYENHGYEIHYLDSDLISLCEDCHQKAHTQAPEYSDPEPEVLGPDEPCPF